MADTEMFKDFARLRTFRKPEEFREVEELAKIDNHVVLAPTHLVEKKGKIVGHFSIGAMPVWFGHLRKGEVTPHDSFRIFHVIESMIEARGMPEVVTFVGKESRLHPHMAELGYVYVGTADIFRKVF